MKTITALILFFTTAISSPTPGFASDGSEQFIACPIPVMKYTTANMDDDTNVVYSDAVEWVVEDYQPLAKADGLPGYAEWIVLIRMVADGDEDLEDYVMRDDNLAQVKVDGIWMLQYDFERTLCKTKRT